MLEEIGAGYRGLVLGVAIAAPVGPVGLLCIRRTIQKGLIIGLATGIGAALADIIWGAIAVLGVGAILAFIHHYEATIRIIGGLIVLATAWHTWHDKPKPPQPFMIVERVLNLTREKVVYDSASALISGFVITITNPLTLFGTLALVTISGGVTEQLEADIMIAGIFTGSVLWWVLLSTGVSLLRHHFTEDRILTINRVTAVALAALAIWALISGARGYGLF